MPLYYCTDYKALNSLYIENILNELDVLIITPNLETPYFALLKQHQSTHNMFFKASCFRIDHLQNKAKKNITQKGMEIISTEQFIELSTLHPQFIRWN